jgi:hypothetical protein
VHDGVTPGRVREWEQLTVAVLILGAITVVGSIAALPLPTSGVLASAVGLPVDAAAVLFLVTGLVWRWMTRRLRRSLGDEEAGQRFAGAWAVALVIFVVIECTAGKALGGPESVHRLRLVAGIARIAWGGLALATIVAMRRDLRGVLTGKPRIAPVPDVPINYDTVVTEALAPADDDFWRAAASAALAVGGEAAVLETTRALERRWLLVSTAGPSEQPAPDAVVTLFPAPQTWLREAPEYFGLIQREPGGAVRFQLVLPSRVNDFKAATKGAHRAELYASDDPAARSAVTSAEQPA